MQLSWAPRALEGGPSERQHLLGVGREDSEWGSMTTKSTSRFGHLCSQSFYTQEERLATSTPAGDKTPSAALDNSEVARALKQRCYPHNGNGDHNWCLSRSPSLSVGFSVHGCSPVRATGGSLPCGRYILAPLTWKKEGARALWCSFLVV